MPNLPKPRFGRTARARGAVVTGPSEPESPNVEIVEAAPDGAPLRWINIERPRQIDRAWLEEHFDFHPLDYEDVFSRNQRPKVDVYDDYLFVVLHFPAYDKQIGRLNAAELDVFVGPDYVVTLPNQPIPPLEYLFERCRTREELREQLFCKGPGYLLYKIVDDCVDASFPMLRKMGNKLERLEEDIFEGEPQEVVRDISNVKQEIINFRKIVRPQRAAFRDLERNKARYIAEDLDIYFEDIIDATERLLERADHWEPRRVDLGSVNGRHFTFAAGMGLDASVVERVDRHPRLKTRFGAWYFTEAAFETFLSRYMVSPPRLAVQLGERTVAGVSVFV